MKKKLFLKNEVIINKVSRALSDLKRSVPILLSDDNIKKLIFSAENFDSNILTYLIQENIAFRVNLVIPHYRANYLIAQKRFNCPLSININHITYNQVVSIIEGLQTSNLVEDLYYKDADKIDIYALKLMKIAELLPALITIETEEELNDDDLITLGLENIDNYIAHSLTNYKKVCSAPLSLTDSKDTNIYTFRASLTGKDHYAIVVKNALSSDCPLIRVHSSCYTGDLLGSLSCDCGDQLKAALNIIHNNTEGGIIIYLMQEGRGIGLVNKLRTYDLQANGLDTVDANQALGYGEDERLFEPAASILRELGVNKIQLLTNNPKKAKDLEELGIKVEKTLPLIVTAHQHNINYLNTKAKKLGHKFAVSKAS